MCESNLGVMIDDTCGIKMLDERLVVLRVFSFPLFPLSVICGSKSERRPRALQLVIGEIASMQSLSHSESRESSKFTANFSVSTKAKQAYRSGACLCDTSVRHFQIACLIS